MGSGKSGIYYTTHGSSHIHHQALIHSLEGEYTLHNRMKGGGHGQDAIDYMDKHGIEYVIVKTLPNGVRIGNVLNHKDNRKSKYMGQTWFPKEWTQKDIVRAAEHVLGLKHNKHKPEGTRLYGVWKGVRVCVIRSKGTVGTVFPDYNQNLKKLNKRSK